ncbi:MAG: hypothetical protein CMI09_08720 [Oceanospirillaceae bacterium]|nr:hypothetical protein [Oceanospirillaceae bacterium]|tara:strand:- start:436 stop:852 length:417 start_codon:yes stop_codon:yes gene_type:complete
MRLIKALLLCALVGLSACSQIPTGSMQAPEQLVRQWTSNDMDDFSQGDFHPAVKALLNNAQQAREEQNWSRAMTWLDQARQIAPRNAELFLRQAWVALQMDDQSLTRQLAERGLVFSEAEATSIKLEQLVKESQSSGR